MSCSSWGPWPSCEYSRGSRSRSASIESAHGGHRVASAHCKTRVAPDGELLAFLVIGPDAAGERQHPPLLAGDVRAHVPGVGLRDERRVGDVIVVLDPFVLRLPGRLDLSQAASP